MNNQLQCLGPETYKDPADNRLLTIWLYNGENGLEARVKKLINPSDCLNPSIRDEPDLQPDNENPLRFYDETQGHSCLGLYWRFDVPVTPEKRLKPDVDLETLKIHGVVSDGSMTKRTVISPFLREAILEDFIHRLPDDVFHDIVPDDLDLTLAESQELVAQNYVRRFGTSLCKHSYTVSFPESPFTRVYTLRGNSEFLMSKTKRCGYTFSDHEVHMQLPVVEQQFAQKRADMQRLYPVLAGLDLSDLPENSSGDIEKKAPIEVLADLELSKLPEDSQVDVEADMPLGALSRAIERALTRLPRVTILYLGQRGPL
jgi:hypothetical protein